MCYGSYDSCGYGLTNVWWSAVCSPGCSIGLNWALWPAPRWSGSYSSSRPAGQGFLSLKGTATYLEVSAELGILAVAVALLMIGGEFDLSVGSMIGAAGMTMTILAVHFGWPLWLAILAALILSLVVGGLNGWLVVSTGLPSFIITLGSLFIDSGRYHRHNAGSYRANPSLGAWEK